VGSRTKNSLPWNLLRSPNRSNRIRSQRRRNSGYRPLRNGADTAAHSTEFVESAKEPVVIFMPEGSRTHLGGTMRLGLRPTLFQKNTEWSVVRKLYGGGTEIFERHRHRYEINPEYIQRLEANGLQFVGRDDKGERMEIFELPAKSETGPSHPYYVGVQYHPELKRCRSLLYIINGSRPLDPSPPFLGFVAASAGVLDEVLKDINGVNGVNGFVNGVNGN
jgi:CTP synthase